MPIVTWPPTSPGQAQITGSPTNCTFGGLPLPNGQGTLGNINLNDVANWFLQDVEIDHSNRAIGIQPAIARARSVFVSDDFLNKIITLSLRYSEVNNPLGYGLAQLSQAGEQYLSFDGGSTVILAKYHGARTPKLVRKYPPFLWDVQIQLICREPWFKDAVTTTSGTTTLIAAPTLPPTATALAGGALAAGTYNLAYTYVTSSGETAASPSTQVAPTFAPSDYRTARVETRGGSRSSGSALQTGMGGLGARSRTIRGVTTSRVVPAGSAVTLAGANLQISVGAVTFPAWATAVKWYFTSGPTTGFTVQNANGNAFTLNTAGNGVPAPSSTPATAFSITYPGSVWCEPVFTIGIPSSSPNSVSSLAFSNAASSEAITVNFPGTLLGGRGYTITMDSAGFTVLDASGNSYDYSGSFPCFYPPSGQINAFTIQLTGIPRDPYGCTFSASYQNRWEL